VFLLLPEKYLPKGKSNDMVSKANIGRMAKSKPYRLSHSEGTDRARRKQALVPFARTRKFRRLLSCRHRTPLAPYTEGAWR
jgi:hypothetical protein